METLPPELKQAIADAVDDPNDLKSLSLVSRDFSDISAFPLFKSLTFCTSDRKSRHSDDSIHLVHGSSHDEILLKTRDNARWPEFYDLPDFLNESLRIARCAEVINFSPMYYSERMTTTNRNISLVRCWLTKRISQT